MSKKSVAFNCAGILLPITLLSANMFLDGNVLADDAVDSVTIIVPAACTFSNTTTGEDYTLSVTPGNYDTVGDTSFQVVCNDSNGFSVYAVGYSNDEYGNTDMVSGVTANPNILTGTSTQGGTSAWAMKLTPVSGTYAPTISDGTNDTEDFTDFHAVPSTFTKVATFPSLTDSVAGSNFQATYRVYVSPSQAPDTYVGKVRYTVVHPESEIPLQPQTTQSGKICYYKNANDAIGVMDACQTISSNTTGYILYPSNFSRDGYGFAGWSDKFDWVVNANDENGNGTGANAGYHIYGPMATISLDPGEYISPNNGLSLYAVWVKAEAGVTMQTFNPNVPPYSTKDRGTVIALKDERDNDTYAVAKLADSKWWMIENLRLDNDSSDNATGDLAQGYGGVFAGLASSEAISSESKWDTTVVANSLYSPDGNNNTINIGVTHTAYRLPRYNNQNTNPATRISASYTPSGNIYSYGNYYTWAAAMANTNDYTSPTAQVDGETSETVGTSICPKGWQLPYGRDTDRGAAVGGFYNLNYKINNDANVTDASASILMRQYPNNFLFTGYAREAWAMDRGSSGNYWSSTARSDGGTSHLLALGVANVVPGTANYTKGFGISVRCVVGR